MSYYKKNHEQELQTRRLSAIKKEFLFRRDGEISEIEQKALAHAEAVEESAACRQYRREIIRKFSPAVYLSWFTKVDLMEEAKQVVIRAANKFVRDYIDANFLDKFEEFGKSRVCG